MACLCKVHPLSHRISHLVSAHSARNKSHVLTRLAARQESYLSAQPATAINEASSQLNFTPPSVFAPNDVTTNHEPLAGDLIGVSDTWHSSATAGHQNNHISDNGRPQSGEIRLHIRDPDNSLLMSIVQQLISAKAEFRVKRGSDGL